MMAGATGDWYLHSKEIHGLLLDISGVLFSSGVAIPGSIDAVKRLEQAKVPLRYVTNETTCTRQQLVDKLIRLGFDLDPAKVIPPAPAMCKVLKDRGLRPYLLVHPELLPDFADIDQSNPNCVILGDAQEHFTYENLNAAFQMLISMQKPVLFSLGGGKYYQQKGKLVLDVGPFAKALEFACSTEGEIVGKPSPVFFNTAVKDLGITPQNALMIGDDIVSDIGGAQACGLRGVQVRTGKFRPGHDEPHPKVTPDGYVDNLLQAVDLFLSHR